MKSTRGGWFWRWRFQQRHNSVTLDLDGMMELEALEELYIELGEKMTLYKKKLTLAEEFINILYGEYVEKKEKLEEKNVSENYDEEWKLNIFGGMLLEE